MITRSILNWPGSEWRTPFAQLERMRRDMDRLGSAMFGRSGLRTDTAGVFPALNLTEDRDNFYVRAELPGIETKDLDLQVHGKSLTIAGERKIASEGESVKYHRREREAGKFSRIIDLPRQIDVDKVEAQMANGVLTVRIAKAEAAKPRQIEVK